MLCHKRGGVAAAKKIEVREVAALDEDTKKKYPEGRDMIRIPGTTKIKALIPPDRLLEEFREKGRRVAQAFRLSQKLQAPFSESAFPEAGVPTPDMTPEAQTNLPEFATKILDPPKGPSHRPGG